MRPSGETDRQLLLDCFNALSPESRRLRFFSSKPHLTAGDLDLFAGADGWDHIAWVAVRLDHLGREQEPLGFARCLRLEPNGDSAEFSVTVADHAQGMGVGTALLDRLVPAARTAGIRHLRCELLAENTAMRHLAKHLGGEAHWLGDGVVEYQCDLPDTPTRSPWGLPWFADPANLATAWMDAWFKGLDDSLTKARTTRQMLNRWLTQPPQDRDEVCANACD
ncbi:MAG TPA: GNAT family N-acetyltransferase [Lamprocystis sp. (in: g-proteobacteria)]|nr:GNAT family N-acetyltransferase [Lamprocystis sp. (in: g-proteobacteria)]